MRELVCADQLWAQAARGAIFHSLVRRRPALAQHTTYTSPPIL